MSPQTKRIAPFNRDTPQRNPLELVCAPDKSLTHRALMFAALAEGASSITNPLFGEDCLSTIHCLETLGARFSMAQDVGASMYVASPGMAAFTRRPVELDCGNSGTSSRLLMGIVAALDGVTATFTGDQSLSSRPMRRVVDPLRALGADIAYLGEPGCLPVRVKGGRLKPGHIVIDKASAQVKSALLLAGLNINGPLTLDLPMGSRDHTEKLLVGMGASLTRRLADQREYLAFYGPFHPKTRDYTIPVDPSSAAFFCVLGLSRPAGEMRLRHILDNPSRTGFLNVLERMTQGKTIHRLPGAAGYVEPVMDLVVKGGGALAATDIAAFEVPALVDEIPILAVAAMFAHGCSRFSGLHELRVKESDRLAKSCELIQRAGGLARVEGDDLVIEGPTPHIPFFVFDPMGDHRLAMAAAVLARASTQGAEIWGPECVAVSFPDFFPLLECVT